MKTFSKSLLKKIEGTFLEEILCILDSEPECVIEREPCKPTDQKKGQLNEYERSIEFLRIRNQIAVEEIFLCIQDLGKDNDHLCSISKAFEIDALQKDFKLKSIQSHIMGCLLKESIHRRFHIGMILPGNKYETHLSIRAGGQIVFSDDSNDHTNECIDL